MKTKIPVLVVALQLTFSPIYSQAVLTLYRDSIPNSRPSIDQEETDYLDGIKRVSKISRPTITVFLPPKNKATGAAVIICPGGGYLLVASGHEGTAVAKKLNEMGVAAIVLKYRVPDTSWMLNLEIGALQDAQQAIKTVRDNAVKWNINPHKLGIMGFSSGGHLASTAGTHFNKVLIPNISNTSVRPDFMILVYPVISFMPGLIHQGSADRLLGTDASEEKLKEYSNELQVTANTPPTFLVHASDDDGVSPMNSIVFYDSLLSKKVPAEIHNYQTGGHGFGMYINKNKELWMDRCKSWMQINGWLKK
ncbi:alpha/beta hydrolase [soil metagenome]